MFRDFILMIFPTTSMRAKVSIKGGIEGVTCHLFQEMLVIILLCFFLDSVMDILKLDVPLFDGRMNFSLCPKFVENL
jgi:hypothetical protein